jgi:hypothetical protein
METNATTLETPAEAVVSTKAATAEPVDCLIHLRFNPNGTVSEIGERPSGVDAQAWFNFLSRNTLNKYQALSGGRGMFRLPREQINALKSACTSESAT